MKVLFLHGLESLPGGDKAKSLAKEGFEVLNPHLPKSSYVESVKIAQRIIYEESPDVIVGSSRGGAVAMSVDPAEAGVVLVAPAWKLFCKTNNYLPRRTLILHSKNDKSVPIGDSEELAKAQGLTMVTCGMNHRMQDKDALEAILEAVQWCSKS